MRQDDPVININNDPTFWEAPEGDRFEGSFWEYIVDETAIIYEERYVDHRYEYYHITLRSEFDRPPLVINPPLRYKLTARAGHSATKSEGAEGVGYQFWYDSDYASVEPSEVLAYYPWFPNSNPQTRKEWMVSAPEPGQEGDTFKLWASWWNCPPCNVTWTYKAEPASAIEQLGVEVMQPVVTYQGEEVLPGQIFFPETCALPDGRAANDCSNTIELSDRAELHSQCMIQALERAQVLMRGYFYSSQKLKPSPEELQTLVWIFLMGIAKNCEYLERADGDYKVGLALEQGGILLDNIISGQTVEVVTPLGKAETTQIGVFVTGYLPGSQTAVFQSLSAPLTIEAISGGSLTLPPAHKVELTAAGFGTVKPLPQIFLPAQMR